MNTSRNQALFKCKNHLTVELYLRQGIWGIRSIWGNWTQIPKWAGIHRQSKFVRQKSLKDLPKFDK